MEGKQKMTQQTLFGNSVRKLSLPSNLDIHISGIIGHNKPLCCVASNFGFGLGMESSYSMSCANCKLTFIDNPFMKYNHEKHVKKVEKYLPKYATTRDIFSSDQCKSLGIDYYTFDEVMHHAEYIHSLGVTPIIIPKYTDIIEKLSSVKDIDKYVIGYSLAKSFGKTKKFNIDMLIDYNYKIHLLGGTPEDEVKFYNKYPDNIVSLDTAIISNKVEHKTIWKPKSMLSCCSFSDVESTLISNKFHNGYSGMSVATSCSLMNYYLYLRDNMIS